MKKRKLSLKKVRISKLNNGKEVVKNDTTAFNDTTAIIDTTANI
ncbi:hypothetical protein [Aquimarina algicola]|nr:hypothetical protein [Aquimarina algicola]